MVAILDMQALGSELSQEFGFIHNGMTVHLGLAVYFGIQLLQGTRRGSLPALVGAAVVALFMAQFKIISSGIEALPEFLLTVCHTMFWPLVAVAVSKFRRWRWNRFNGDDARHVEAVGSIVMGTR